MFDESRGCETSVAVCSPTTDGGRNGNGRRTGSRAGWRGSSSEEEEDEQRGAGGTGIVAMRYGSVSSLASPRPASSRFVSSRLVLFPSRLAVSRSISRIATRHPEVRGNRKRIAKLDHTRTRAGHDGTGRERDRNTGGVPVQRGWRVAANPRRWVS